MKFSIIIPVYNVEKYLKDCLDSIINQSYKDLEIICIDDGSTDNSLNILKEYATKDNRIIVESQKNQGQGVARNNGIKIASGEYITFVDPDDWIKPGLYEKLKKIIDEKKSEVIEFEYKTFLESANKYIQGKYERRLKEKCKFDIKAHDSYNWKNLKNILLNYKSSSCTKAYLKSFILNNNIFFPPHKNGEDVIFTRKVLFKASKIDLLHEAFYIYRRRPNSSTTTSNKKNTIFMIDQIKETEDFIKDNNIDKILKKDFENYKFRILYEAYKYSNEDCKKDIKKYAREYLSYFNYLNLCLKISYSSFLQNIFLIKKNYMGTNKTIIVIFGCKIEV